VADHRGRDIRSLIEYKVGIKVYCFVNLLVSVQGFKSRSTFPASLAYASGVGYMSPMAASCALRSGLCSGSFVNRTEDIIEYSCGSGDIVLIFLGLLFHCFLSSTSLVGLRFL